MNDKCRVSLAGPLPPDLDSLMSDYGSFKEGDGRTWLVPLESLQNLLDELWERAVDFRVSPLTAAGDERAEDLAGYLGLFRVDEVEELGPGPVLTYDLPRIELPLANQNLIDIMTPLAPEVTWEPTGKPGFWRLAHAPDLPDPLRVKVLHDKDQGATGYWLLTTDGHNYLTERNLEFLRAAGMARCGLTQHEDTVYPTLPVPIYSGRVIDALLKSGVRFAAPPVYLRKEAEAEQ